MMTVREVSELTGVSIRTLHHYDSIGLLSPSMRTEAGYRLYDEDSLARLQQILLFRELEFSLRDIREILSNPGFDRTRALQQQIELLELKRDHIENLLALARGLKDKEVSAMAFEPFDTSVLDEYTAEAKKSWGSTKEWEEYERKSKGRTMDETKAIGTQMMSLFEPFAKMAATGVDPASEESKAQARLIQEYITEHFYTCSDEVFLQLGRAYGSGGEFTKNIDATAGEGAAVFAMHAIEALVKQ